MRGVGVSTRFRKPNDEITIAWSWHILKAQKENTGIINLKKGNKIQKSRFVVKIDLDNSALVKGAQGSPQRTT